MSERVTISIYDGDTLLASDISAILQFHEPTDLSLGQWRGIATVTGNQARTLIQSHRLRLVADNGRCGWISMSEGLRDKIGAWTIYFEGVGEPRFECSLPVV